MFTVTSRGLPRGAPCVTRCGFGTTALTLCLNARSQRIHKIDHVRPRGPLWLLDLLPLGLLFDQLPKGIFVLIFEFLRIKVAALGVDNVQRQIQYILWHFLFFDIVEIIALGPDLIRVAQRDTQHPVVSRFQRDDVFARGEYDLSDGDHAFLADRFADHRERLLPDLAIWRDVVRVANIQLVNLRLWNEFLNLDGSLTLNGYGFKFFAGHVDVFSLS